MILDVALSTLALGRVSEVFMVRMPPNVLRLSGERKRVRCSREFGESLLMSRDTPRRYAGAGVLFNGPELGLPGTR